MKQYEVMLILKPNVPPAQKDEIKKKISDKIAALQGKIQSFNVWREMSHFCFPLQTKGAGREKYYEGSYWLLNCELPPQNLGELKELIRLEESILRNLILRSDQ